MTFVDLWNKYVEVSTYTMRRFLEQDIAAYKKIRLEALKTEPGMFGNSYAHELGFNEDEWKTRVLGKGSACFGLYCDEDLIGITGIVVDKEKAAEAYMTQSYIRKAYRGRGLSKMLYDARMDWAEANGIKRLTIGHRRTNFASKAANQKFGFVFTRSQSRACPDGATEDMLYYELIL